MSILDSVKSGRLPTKPKLLISGEAGIGKSTFASGFPAPIFLEAESRTGHLDIARLQLTGWDDCLKAMHAAIESDYQTVVIDTIDALEQMLFNYVAKQNGVDDHENVNGGYCKYRSPLLKQWRRFMNLADKLSAAEKQVILLAHTEIKTHSPPNGEPYDRYQLKMDKASNAFIMENVDLAGYAGYRVVVRNEKDIRKTGKASTSGKRVLTFKHDPALPTKPGVGIVDKCELNYDSYVKGLS